MILRHIERGTQLCISDPAGQIDGILEYDAIFHDMHDLVRETSFVVQCAKISRNFSSFDRNAILEISFTKGPNIYSFTGRITSKINNDMIVFEQTSEIETLNRRIYQRDEIRVEVKVYGLPEELLNAPRYTIPDTKPVLTDVSFDVSSGGMCIISNIVLSTEYDPYYLVEFFLSDKDWFLFPAKLVRRSKFARSRVGKHDYGFQFIFDNLPEDKIRLTKAILNKKLSFLRN